MWVAPRCEASALQRQQLIEAQHSGVLGCFRLIKALLEQGYGARELQLTVITERSQAVHEGEELHCAHASVHGLVGSVAKEYPLWTVRLVDVDEAPLRLSQLLTLPADAHGNARAYRQGRWYQQELAEVQLAEALESPYRRGGVYVLIGGAGGIGEVFSEYVIRHHQAQVVWIGRRAQDQEIQQKIERLAQLGPAPQYIQADAGRISELKQAYAQIIARYGRVHGVVHSAIVLLDKTLANMDEERLTRLLPYPLGTHFIARRQGGPGAHRLLGFPARP